MITDEMRKDGWIEHDGGALTNEPFLAIAKVLDDE